MELPEHFLSHRLPPVCRQVRPSTLLTYSSSSSCRGQSRPVKIAPEEIVFSLDGTHARAKLAVAKMGKEGFEACFIELLLQSYGDIQRRSIMELRKTSHGPVEFDQTVA